MVERSGGGLAEKRGTVRSVRVRSGQVVPPTGREFDENKAPEKGSEPVRVVPPTEREMEMVTHLNTIESLQKDVGFLEGVRKVISDVPSIQSLGQSIETLKGAQGRLYESLNAKYGMDSREADKIIAADKSAVDAFGATPDMLTKLRERVAMYGDEAVKAFDNSGQFDAGILKDLGNRAVNVQGVPEPSQAVPEAVPLVPSPVSSQAMPQDAPQVVPQAVAQAPSQIPQIQAEQEKIVANLIDLSNQEKKISQQIVGARKTLNPEEIRALEQARAQIRQEYKEKFAEVTKRPDRKEIIKKWENTVKLELKIEREAKAKEQEKTPARTK